ncbi:HIT domain-containing protein [Candidatus Woesearchaeota archaeon]|nr:HIT domain-containing protein [Candidatus Woesearchaeota archaeon]
MDDQCIFCQMIAGSVPTRTVYRDDKCIAILDINPASPGHVLIIPSEHVAIMPQLPDDLMGHLGVVAKKVSRALIKGLKAQGTTTFVANGVAGGQRAQHFMVHVIPRLPDDGIHFDLPKHELSEKQFLQVRAAIAPSIKTVLGFDVPGVEVRSDKEESADGIDTGDGSDGASENDGQGFEEDEAAIVDEKKGGSGLDELTDFLTK